MPYICLVRNDLPDGAVYLKSLRSESQRVPSIDPPGQARYINRPQNDALYLSTAGVVSQDTYGLTAYFADRLEPGGTEVATGTITSAGPLVGDTLTVGGVTFTAAESTATGTILSNGPLVGDTVTIKGIVFTAAETNAVGGCTVLATCAAGDSITIDGNTFTAVNAAPGANEFLDAQAPNSADASAASLAAQVTAAAIGITATNPGAPSPNVTFTAVAPGLAGVVAVTQTGNHITLTGLTGGNLTLPAVSTATREFSSMAQSGSDIVSATSLVAAINDVTPVTGGQTLILAALPVGVGCTATNVGGTSATVTLTATAPGAQGEFAMLESTAGVRFTLSGATMVSVAPNPALQQFASLIEAGSNALVAASIQATINNAASQLLLVAANGGYTVACGAPAVATVTLTPDVAGELGAFTLATSAPARVTLSGTHLTRTFETWTVARLAAISAGLIARLDAGLALTEAAINIVINAVPGVSNTSISSPASTTTLADILSIMAGRGYYLPAGATKLTNAWTWNTTAAGGFGIPYLAQDSRMLGGEIRPNTIGGDVATREVKPIRHTYLTDELIESLDDGEIAVFLAKAGMPAVTLWPRSGIIPQYPWTYQKALLNPKAEVDNAQLIVVYDDDGSILV